jgi:hypothetical protein
MPGELFFRTAGYPLFMREKIVESKCEKIQTRASDLSPDVAFAHPFESTLIARGDERDAALSILRNLNGLDLIRAAPSENGIGPVYQH